MGPGRGFWFHKRPSGFIALMGPRRGRGFHKHLVKPVDNAGEFPGNAGEFPGNAGEFPGNAGNFRPERREKLINSTSELIFFCLFFSKLLFIFAKEFRSNSEKKTF